MLCEVAAASALTRLLGLLVAGGGEALDCSDALPSLRFLDVMALFRGEEDVENERRRLVEGCVMGSRVCMGRVEALLAGRLPRELMAGFAWQRRSGRVRQGHAPVLINEWQEDGQSASRQGVCCTDARSSQVPCELT